MKPRAMEVLGSPNYLRTEVLPIPVVGRVAAGEPILAQENIEDHMLLPTDLLGEGEHFILEVRGESMINVGILHGDYLVIRSQSDAHNGEIVVAMVEDDATVKRFFKENGRFRLQPENDAMEPIYADDVTVLGKVVSMYRRL
jgi:repressor LexA